VLLASDLNDYARQLLTCEPADLRDANVALRYAERAAVATHRNDANVLDTLALAFHLTGNHGRAVELEERAISLMPANSTGRSELEQHLQQYRARMSWPR